jgi:hypothetical protein
MLTIMASLAQQESQSLSQNVKMGLQYRYQQGEVQVNCNRFLGYTRGENNKLVIVPEEAEVVKRIYREYLEGASMLKIARGLMKDGILNGAGNERWHTSKTRYFRVTRLLTDLAIARGDGSYNRLMNDLKKIELLILDDWGLNVFDPLACRDLLEVVEDRYDTRSTLIASQLPVSSWYAIFQDSTIADAILDRLVHAAYRIELAGASRRTAPAEKGGVVLP